MLINGTAGNNVLTGTTDGDQINGLAGNDTLNALTRPTVPGSPIDSVDGGDGIDTLVVNAAGETQAVTLASGINPTFTVNSTSGNFAIEAYNMEMVKFTGGSGNDVINTGDYGGTVDGGSGIDWWLADLAGLFNSVVFTLGTTTKITAAGLSSILGIERISLTTSLGDDIITGGSQADSISTGDGDDTINARTRAPGGAIDVVQAGDGTDTLIVDASAETQAVTLAFGSSPTYTVNSLSGNFAVEAYGIEKIRFTGGSANDTIDTGTAGGTVNGGGGIDEWRADLSDLVSDVSFTLGTSTKITEAELTSILGVERLVLKTGSGIDTITGGAQADNIQTADGNDTINLKTRSSGTDIADGGAGTDTLVVDASAETQAVTLFAGSNPNWTVNSLSGNFILEAYNMEKIKFTGGSGNDTIDTASGGVTVNGGGGTDDHWLANLGHLTTAVAFTLGTTTNIVAAGLTSILGIERLNLTTGSGNDTIAGGARNDNLNTGAGNDTINLKTRTTGLDVADGGTGIDTLIVDAAAETQSVTLSVGSAPTHTVNSTSGNFAIEAYNMEKVKFTGGSGNDTIDTGTGGVVVNGGGGSDYWSADLRFLTSAIAFTLGTTTTIAPAGLTSILGIERINLMFGSGHDTIVGGGLADTIRTGGGNDVIDLKTRTNGTDLADGGDGTDTLIVNASAETQGVTLFTGTAPTYTVNSLSGNFTIEAYNMEKVKFTGGSGNDTINTGAGAALVHGGLGTDTWLANYSQLNGPVNYAVGSAMTSPGGTLDVQGIERISLTTGSGADVVTGGVHDDFIGTGDGNDIIDLRTRITGTDVADGGGGIDTLIVDASAQTQAVVLNLGSAPTYSVTSTSGHFHLEAYNMEKVQFTGGSGDDTINTGNGGVTVNGGGGSDHWLADFSQISSAVTFVLGTTTAIAAAGLTSILGIERITLRTGGGNDTVTGGGLADNIITGAGNDTIDLKTTTLGTDVADGGKGIDTLIVNASAETQTVTLSAGASPTYSVTSASGKFTLEAYNMEKVQFTGGSGADTATGLKWDDLLSGGNGNDSLNGGDGNDTLNGGNNNDLLRGARGADLLTGGSGNDTFDYDAATESSVLNGMIDSLQDFVAGFDKIDLTGIDANGRALDGDQAFAFIGGAAFAGIRGELRSVSGVIEADLNGDTAADFRILLTNGATAGVGDFLL